jgi:hypothetical protein
MQCDWAYHGVELIAPKGDGVRLLVRCNFYRYTDGAVYCNADEVCRAMYSHQTSVQVWKKLREVRPVLEQMCSELGWDMGREYLPSVRMVRQGVMPEAQPQKTRSCQCISPQLLMLWVLCHAVHSQRHKFKDIGKAIARVLFQTFCNRSCCTMEPFDKLCAELQGECSCEDKMACVFARSQRIRVVVQNDSDKPLELLGLLEKMMSGIFHCDFARQTLKVYGKLFAESLSSTLEKSDFNTERLPHKIDVLGSRRKRRRAEDTYRHSLLAGLVRKRRARGRSHLGADGWAKATHSRWVQSHNVAYLLSTRRQLGSGSPEGLAGGWCLREDATRVGNPSRETLLGIISKQTAFQSAVLVPQVPLGSLGPWNGQGEVN